MTLRNRVLPDGTIHAIPARGTMTGNRGILHTSQHQMGTALWKHRAWICCTLDWEGRRRPVMTGRNWTELFFLDEAVAMAAGHRPCGYCRRDAFDRFKSAWHDAHGPWPGVQAVDAALHHARAIPGARVLRNHAMPATDLPDGAMFYNAGHDWIRLGASAHRYAPDGYGPATSLPTTTVNARTCPPLQAVLHAGYRPALHPSLRSNGTTATASTL